MKYSLSLLALILNLGLSAQSDAGNAGVTIPAHFEWERIDIPGKAIQFSFPSSANLDPGNLFLQFPNASVGQVSQCEMSIRLINDSLHTFTVRVQSEEAVLQLKEQWESQFEEVLPDEDSKSWIISGDFQQRVLVKWTFAAPDNALLELKRLN